MTLGYDSDNIIASEEEIITAGTFANGKQFHFYKYISKEGIDGHSNAGYEVFDYLKKYVGNNSNKLKELYGLLAKIQEIRASRKSLGAKTVDIRYFALEGETDAETNNIAVTFFGSEGKMDDTETNQALTPKRLSAMVGLVACELIKGLKGNNATAENYKKMAVALINPVHDKVINLESFDAARFKKGLPLYVKAAFVIGSDFLAGTEFAYVAAIINSIRCHNYLAIGLKGESLASTADDIRGGILGDFINKEFLMNGNFVPYEQYRDEYKINGKDLEPAIESICEAWYKNLQALGGKKAKDGKAALTRRRNLAKIDTSDF